jgi:surface antigen
MRLRRALKRPFGRTHAANASHGGACVDRSCRLFDRRPGRRAAGHRRRHASRRRRDLNNRACARRDPRPGAALGGVLGGPVGASLSDGDRQAAWDAQIAALNSGQRRSWRGAHGVFGFIEPGAAMGDGCRAYSQTIYIEGRPNHGRGLGCKQPDGSWKMTS